MLLLLLLSTTLHRNKVILQWKRETERGTPRVVALLLCCIVDLGHGYTSRVISRHWAMISSGEESQETEKWLETKKKRAHGITRNTTDMQTEEEKRGGEGASTGRRRHAHELKCWSSHMVREQREISQNRVHHDNHTTTPACLFVNGRGSEKSDYFLYTHVSLTLARTHTLHSLLANYGRSMDQVSLHALLVNEE